MSEEKNEITQEQIDALLEALAGQEMTPEQIQAARRKQVLQAAFVLPFVRLWWSLKLGVRGLFGVLMIPVYVAIMLVSAILRFTIGAWPFIVPVIVGSYLTYTLPYGNVANTAIAFSSAVATFGVITLVVGYFASRDED